jgi:hypothetical protein
VIGDPLHIETQQSVQRPASNWLSDFIMSFKDTSIGHVEKKDGQAEYSSQEDVPVRVQDWDDAEEQALMYVPQGRTISAMFSLCSPLTLSQARKSTGTSCLCSAWSLGHRFSIAQISRLPMLLACLKTLSLLSVCTSPQTLCLHTPSVTLLTYILIPPESRYSIALLVFFPTYALFELPSNLLIRRVGARYWLSFLIVCWGIMVLAMGFVLNWVPLVALRVLLGAFEAGCKLSESAPPLGLVADRTCLAQYSQERFSSYLHG